MSTEFVVMQQGQPTLDAAYTRVGPVSAGDIVKTAFRLTGQHAAVVFGASIILQLAMLVVSFAAFKVVGMLGFAVWMVLLLASTQVSIGIYTHFLLHRRHGHETPSAVYLIKESLPFLPRLCWLAVLTSVGIMIGVIFLVLPGLYLALRWAVAGPALVARRESATEAMSTSAALSSQAYGTVFLVLVFVNLLTNAVPQILIDPTMPLENMLIMTGVLAALVTPIVGLATAELFFRLAGVPDRIPAPGTIDPAPQGPFVPVPAAHAAPPHGYAGHAPQPAYAPAAHTPAPAYAGHAPQPAYAQAAHAHAPQPAYAQAAAPGYAQTSPLHGAAVHGAPPHAVPSHAGVAPPQPHAHPGQAPQPLAVPGPAPLPHAHASMAPAAPVPAPQGAAHPHGAPAPHQHAAPHYAPAPHQVAPAHHAPAPHHAQQPHAAPPGDPAPPAAVAERSGSVAPPGMS